MWVSSSPIVSRSVLRCCGQISRGISSGYSRYMEDCISRRTTCVSKRRDLSLRRPRYELLSFPPELFDSKYDLNSWYSPSATFLPLNYRKPSDSDTTASSSSSKATKSSSSNSGSKTAVPTSSAFSTSKWKKSGSANPLTVPLPLHLPPNVRPSSWKNSLQYQPPSRTRLTRMRCRR